MVFFTLIFLQGQPGRQNYFSKCWRMCRGISAVSGRFGGISKLIFRFCDWSGVGIAVVPSVFFFKSGIGDPMIKCEERSGIPDLKKTEKWGPNGQTRNFKNILGWPIGDPEILSKKTMAQSGRPGFEVVQTC